MLRISVVALFIVAGVVRADDAPKLEWKEFKSEEGRFKGLMPGTPKTMDQDIPTPLGKVKNHMFLVEVNNDLVYMLSYIDYPDAISNVNPQDILKGVGAAMKAKGDLLSDKELTLGKDKVPGYEVIGNQGAMKMRNRIFLDKNRMYQVTLVAKTKDEMTTKDAEKFYDSFEITK